MIVRTPTRRTDRSAFTLVEMLVVVAIILALAAIAVPITLSVRDSSYRDIAKAQCKGLLSQAVESYRLDQDANPDSGLPSSWDDVMRSAKAGLKPDALNDPWGHQYHLAAPGQHNPDYDIWSDCGGSATPVGNWKD